MFTSPFLFILLSGQLLQLFPVQHLHAAPEQPHPALLRKVFQHPAHHLAGRPHVFCHLVVGHAHLVAAGLGQLIGKKKMASLRSALMNSTCCMVHMLSEKRSAVIW